jgi:hypothetical protein
MYRQVFCYIAIQITFKVHHEPLMSEQAPSDAPWASPQDARSPVFVRGCKLVSHTIYPTRKNNVFAKVKDGVMAIALIGLMAFALARITVSAEGQVELVRSSDSERGAFPLLFYMVNVNKIHTL